MSAMAGTFGGHQTEPEVVARARADEGNWLGTKAGIGLETSGA